jgi:hypothetical protein
MGSGALEPISDGTSEENRALATALRTLFAALDMSVRRYGARCHTDPGTVSRYLKGTRVPPWNFIKDLLAHVAEHREQQANDETVALLRQLYVKAAGASTGTGRVADLQLLLEEADQQAREAASLERLLQQALQESQQQVDQLNVEMQSLRAARAADRQTASKEIERYASEADSLRAEKDQLEQEVALLRGQLAEAKAARMLAEEQCDRLERQIEDAEGQEREAKRAEAERRSADAEQEVERATEEFNAAQERIAQLQSELAEVRRQGARSNTREETYRPTQIPLTGESNKGTIASKLGYSPGQVLRRVDAAQKENPPAIHDILSKALDLQNSEELKATEKLLQSMPLHVRQTFGDLTSRSTRIYAPRGVLDNQGNVNAPDPETIASRQRLNTHKTSINEKIQDARHRLRRQNPME